MWLLFIAGAATGWAAISVLDSALVRWYDKHPLALMWPQACFSMSVLTLVAFTVQVRTPWALALACTGMVAYGGDILFFYILNRVDASVSNIAWAILAVLLCLAGFLFFHEIWSWSQAAGAVLVLGGTVFLSVWHRQESMGKSLLMLGALALFYVPFYIVKKAALIDGQSVASVFFWLLIGRESLSFIVPLIVPRFRRRVFALAGRVDWKFFALSGLVIALFFSAEYLGTLAYLYGPISLVAVVANIQPFIVILLAWIGSIIAVQAMPKEILSAQSVGIKLVSFSIVFCGLALLALSQ